VGNGVTFTCTIRVKPKHVVNWIVNNEKGERYGKLKGVNNNELVIESLSLKHNGYYTCSSFILSTNGKYIRFLATTLLKVFGKFRSN